MTDRFEYVLECRSAPPSARLPAGVEARKPTPRDSEALAALMLDAYRGTIDYDRETLANARSEVDGYFAGSSSAAPLLEASRVAVAGAGIVGACLVSDWERRTRPLVGYVMTRAAEKRRGIARALVAESVVALCDDYPDVRAVITAGNTPSERLFESLGFRRVNP